MRKALKADFLQRAYDYIEDNGEATASHLLDVLRVRKTTGRVDANLPTLSTLVQWLRIDKRFVGIDRPVPKIDADSSHYLLKHYNIAEVEE